MKEALPAVPDAFGVLLRRAREERGRSVAHMARELGVSAPFLHQIESGERGPLSRQKIHRASVCLRVSRLQLEHAALCQRGEVALPEPETVCGKETLARLSSLWDELDDVFFGKLDDLLTERETG